MRFPQPRRRPFPLAPPLLTALLLGATACDGGIQANAGDGPPREAPTPRPGDAGRFAPVETAALSAAPLPSAPLDERVRAPTRGMDAELLGEAIERAGELTRLYSMIVARHGEIVAEQHVRGPSPGTPTNIKSASKTVLSALVGIAFDQGLFHSLDQPVQPFLHEYLSPDDARAGITVGHLLTMQSGLESTSSGNYGRWVLSSNWVRHAITRPLVSEPGTRMVYSTGNSHLLSAVLTSAAGVSTHAFARDHLAAPLGIQVPRWLTDPQGIFFGGNDMVVSARDLLRFGELYRNGGRIDGVQVISRAWVEDSWRPHARSPRNGDLYGLGWWGRESNGYSVRFAWGYGGQFLFVVPALELTVVFTSDPVSPREGPHNRAIHNMIDQLLVPAAIRGGAPPPSPSS